MSSSMSKAAGVIALCLLGAGGAAAAPLFEPVTVLTRAGTAQQPALQALMGAPSTSAVQEVRVDAAAVASAQKQLEFELLGQPVQECMMVGDSATDLHAANNAGMPIVLVRYGYTRDLDLQAADAVAVIDDMPALLPIL